MNLKNLVTLALVLALIFLPTALTGAWPTDAFFLWGSGRGVVRTVGGSGLSCQYWRFGRHLSLSPTKSVSESAAGAAEAGCPDVNIPCTCDDALRLFSRGLNNDPYKIDAADLDGLTLSDSCETGLGEKITAGETGIRAIFGVQKGGTRFSPESFLKLVSSEATNNALRRFNELHPHEASFIISRLIKRRGPQDLKLARDMLDNFYASAMSENNTIPTNIREYFEATKDYNWLERYGLPNAVKIVEHWNTRIGGIDLGDEEEETVGRCWFAGGAGPRPEVWNPTERQYYFQVLYELIKLASIPNYARPAYAKDFDYNRVVDVASNSKVDLWRKKGALESIDVKFDDQKLTDNLSGHTYIMSGGLSASKADEPVIELSGVFYNLTPTYYSNDRAYQTSGYNSTHLYGPWGAFVDEFVDAAHNIQLFRANADIAKMYDHLANHYKNSDKKRHDEYREKFDLYKSEADAQKDVVFKYLWNKELGMIFNYNNHTDGQQTIYPSAGGGYAIWAGLFDIDKPEELKMLFQIIDYISKTLEGPAGYYASAVETGLKWDKPYVWPVHQGMIIDGLRRYAEVFTAKNMKKEAEGLTRIADRIALKYLITNLRDWVKSRGTGVSSDNKAGDGVAKVVTGFQTGLNYSWNLAAVWDMYSGLTKEAKEIFEIVF